MNAKIRELTDRQIETACGGAYLNNRRADGGWEYVVIDLDGNVVAAYWDVVEALDHCMYNHLDSSLVTWPEVERRQREAQYRREHGLPPRSMYETIYDIWLVG